jgi:hypothetical protein
MEDFWAGAASPTEQLAMEDSSRTMLTKAEKALQSKNKKSKG